MDVVLDQIQDTTGREIHRLTSLYPPPDFVKTASHDSICGTSEALPAHLYGDSITRTYPCNNPAATWMSAAFFGDKQASYNQDSSERIKSNILRCASYYGIGGQVTELMGKIAADSRDTMESLPDSDFAWVWAQDDGRKERHLPLRNEHEIKAAADYLVNYRDEFVFDDRRKMAEKIIKKAQDYGVTVNDDVLKQAGHGHCSIKSAARFLRDRARLIKNTEIADQLVKTAAAIEQRPASSREHMLKLAKTVSNIDQEFGIYRDYSATVPRPEDALFGITETTVKAAHSAHIPMTSGAIYKLADLAKVKLQDVRDWMGSDLANEVSAGGVLIDQEKLAEILPTLPRGDAELFERMLNKNGINPFAKEASSEEQGLSKQDLFKLAASYEN